MRPATSPSDAELIARARAGDDGAYSELRARHVAAARRLVGRAGRFGPRGDDVVDEAFAVVLDALRRGAGPDIDFRTYLFSVLRRGAARPAEGTVPLGRVAVEPPPPGPGLARAYEALPERWRAVLWYTDVEGTPPSAVEAHLGLSSTEVAALAYRAREALRQSYVAIRIDAEPSDDCRRARERIEAHAVGALTSGEDVRVQHHLDTCTACAALAAELVDLRGSLARAVGPRYLGAAAGSYLARVPVAEPPVPITEPVARDRRRPVGPVRVGAAALIVLVAALVTLMVYAASGASVSEETAASEGEAAADLGRADPDHGPRAADADTTVGVGDGPTSPPADGATATQRDTAPSTAPAATSDNRDAPDPPSSTGSPGASSAPTATAPPPAPPATTPPVVIAPPVAAAPALAPAADLTVGVSGTHPGSSSVTVVVANAGPHAAASPTVQLSLRRAPRYVPAGCTLSQNQLSVSCSFGVIPTGRQSRVSIAVADGTDVVRVRVLSSTGDPTPANNVWSVVSNAITVERAVNGVS